MTVSALRGRSIVWISTSSTSLHLAPRNAAKDRRFQTVTKDRAIQSERRSFNYLRDLLGRQTSIQTNPRADGILPFPSTYFAVWDNNVLERESGRFGIQCVRIHRSCTNLAIVMKREVVQERPAKGFARIRTIHDTC